MIRVCDAIMGTGKSSAAITYMNEHKDQKFIYITPYLDEAERIKKGCPELKFVEPSDKIGDCGFSKSKHTAVLIKEGRNIASTHQAFKRYSEEMLDDINKNEYTLIIDENLDILESYECHPDDMQLAIDAGYIEESDEAYTLVRDGYCGERFRDMFELMKVRQLIKMEEGNDPKLFYWLLPPNLITSFKDVIVMTYMFSGQSINYFLKMYNLPFEYVGIEKDSDDTYRFCEYPGYTPEYVHHIKDMIHILDNERMNSIGDNFHALSMTWYETKKDKVTQLKKNMHNCVNNIWKDAPADEKLWGAFKTHSSKIKGLGYSRAFLTFNARATNAYRNRKYLIYAVNIFMNVSEKKFYERHGIRVNEDLYALSIMVQWIWRSAIRDGDEIYLYIPSRRMREMLINWMDKVGKEGNKINEK